VEARAPMTGRFVLLDRDGTINQEVDHLDRVDQVALIPGAAAAMRRLSSAGLGLGVLTHQANVGRGLLPADRLEEIHARLTRLLSDEGVRLNGLYVCPHAPEDGCDCRKPKAGLALRAATDHGFRPDDSFVVGDHVADMGLGRAIGAVTILVRTGHGEDELKTGAGAQADHVVADLREAAGVVLDSVVSGVRP
jgi:D-glycero-D-manno-heptose 1,7-bisphosphate phosphatase